MQIAWQDVKSSAFKRAGWDSETRTSWLEFNDGTITNYPSMAWTQFQALVNAPSAGKHYNAYWRGKQGQSVGRK